MKTSRYATPRQKACLHCSTAKVKCDRKPDRCTRCTLRRLSCTYPGKLPAQAGDNGIAESSSHLSTSSIRLPSPESDFPAIRDAEVEPIQPLTNISPNNAPPFSAGGSETSDFSGLEFVSPLELFCPLNVDDIRNRWLNSYVPIPGQKPKEYPASITAFTYRLLKSYAAIVSRGRGVPPFVHASQTTESPASLPLSTCLTVVHICENPLPGSESVAADVLQRQMVDLYEQHELYDDMTLLAALQAYLIYSLALFFKLSQGTGPITFLRQAMTNLQDLACSTGRRGLMCVAEQRRERPRWESWIVAEAKRRTLYVMYLFDSVLSAEDGLPTFLGTELQGLPAPASRHLWTACSREQWDKAYNLHLADWAEGGLRIDELWPIPADLDDAGVQRRRNRVDQWLEGIDEFGTMLYAVTSCTHGG